MKLRYSLTILVLLLVLTACNLPGGVDPLEEAARAWIDAPLDGSQLPLAPYEVVYHGTDPNGISRVELRINNELVDSNELLDPGAQIQTLRYLWQPSAPGQYTLTVRTHNLNGTWGEEALADVIIVNESRPVEQTPAPQPTDDPAPTACQPTATFTVDANCRKGPDLAYELVTSLNTGQSVSILGKNQQSTWWKIQIPNSDRDCWVSGTTVETACNSEELPLISSPPLITTPTVSTNDFYWGDCDLRKVTIKADVVGDHPISYVEIYFRIKQQSWSQAEMARTGENTYLITLNSISDIPGAREQIPSILWYYLVAMDTSGLSSVSETFQNVTLSKCP